MLCEAVGCSRQGDVWLGLGESLQHVCVGRKVLAPWAFPAGPKPSSLGSGWAVEGSCRLPSQCSVLCSLVGNWEITTRHWLLQRSFRTRELAPRALESAWVPPLSSVQGICRGLNLWAAEGDTGMDQHRVRSLQPHRPQHQVSVFVQGCVDLHARWPGLRNKPEWALGTRRALSLASKRLRLHVPGPATLLSSVPQPRNTSMVSWSDRSIMSICSSMSTFTSMEEMLPRGAAETEASKKVSAGARQRALPALCRQHHEERTSLAMAN